MRVGILTFHCADNYGAMLQAYATLHFLRDAGLNAEIINYQPSFLKNPYKAWSLERMFRSRRPQNLIHAIYNEVTLYFKRSARKKSFETFFNQYIVEGKTKVVTTIPDSYDVYIVGSDQVWNQDITLKLIDAYFCRFNFSHIGKKYIAYAASLGKSKLTETEITYFKKNLSNFDAISVREKDTKVLLQPYVSKSIHVVLDPTLLLRKKQWEKLATSYIPSEKYVLIYQVREHPQVLRHAQKIASGLCARIVRLVAWPNHNSDINYQTKNPQDFISLIKNAACVITTSFHATAFSIIFEVPFYVVRLNDGKDERSENLLRICGLNNRMVGLHDEIEFNAIDYSETRIRLKHEREQSCGFLLKSIGYE